MRKILSQTRLGIALVILSSFLVSCSTQASSQYWGQVNPPTDNKMRYITGSEPESLDPQFVTGQPEARILIGMFDRLVEYHPKTMQPIPSLATHWEVSDDLVNYTFHLRKGAKFSNGDPIKASDFLYSFRRALSPELASRYAFIGYEIKYAEDFNSAKYFVKKDGKFLLAKDFEEKKDAKEQPATDDKSDATKKEAPKESTSEGKTEEKAKKEEGQSDFATYINSPARLTLTKPDEKDEKSMEAHEKLLKEKPGLKEALEGAEYVQIKPEDIGIEVLDDYTLRITLKQPAPYFVGMLTHQFFSALHKPTVEKEGWTEPENAPNMVVSGAYKVKEWKPYDELTVEKNPEYWDAERVSLDEITFYPMDEQTTMMNIYKSGRVDALYNHTVPAAWNEYIRTFKDEYLLHPEVAIEYYTFSVKKKPVDNVKVRKAFGFAINREALEVYRKTVKKSVSFTPEGIFPEYEEARKRVWEKLRKEANIPDDEWEKRYFNPKKACELMKEAGYTVNMDGEKCKVTDFPADEIQLSYNTAESNKQVAVFVQQQWSQNLGIDVQLKNMEWKTYLKFRSAVEYKGMARAGWVGDYMDPYTFLSQFYSPKNDSSTGWWDKKYDDLLDEANNLKDPTKRFEKMAEAEFYMLQDQPVIPLSTNGTSWMKKPYVKGMYPNPGTMHPWKFIYFEGDRNKWDSNVDNILKEENPKTYAHINDLMKTQIEFEKSKNPETEKDSDSNKAEEE